MIIVFNANLRRKLIIGFGLGLAVLVALIFMGMFAKWAACSKAFNGPLSPPFWV